MTRTRSKIKPKIAISITISLLIVTGFIPEGQISENNVKKTDTLKINRSFNALFDSEELLEFTILTDINELRRDIGENRVYHKALVIYKAFDTVDVVTKAKVKTRGRLRRKKEVCDFPPLKIKMKKTDAIGTIFSANDEFKIVTHCQTSINYYQQYIVLEYIIYKMYQLITDYSFNVRMAKITYSDFNSKVEDIVKYALIVEVDNKLADRYDGKLLEVKNVHPNYTAPSIMNKLAIFQYMVGNTDWSVKVLHNIKLLFIENSAPIPIPYDFDYAGLVNAKYAVPAEELNISSVKVRHYNGFCVSVEKIEKSLSIFKEKEDEITSILSDNKYLDSKVKERNIKYLKDFFEIINNPKKIKQVFIKGCRDD